MKLQDLSSKRAEFIAELLMQDMKPEFLARVSDVPAAPADLFAAFRTKDNRLVTIGVEVKTTRGQHGDSYTFRHSLGGFQRIKNSNLPILFLLVDPKTSEAFYGWATDATIDSGTENSVRVRVPVRRFDPAGQTRLRREIEQK